MDRFFLHLYGVVVLWLLGILQWGLAVDSDPWPYKMEIERPVPQNQDPQKRPKPLSFKLWLPSDGTVLRALLVTGTITNEKVLAHHSKIRALGEELKMGILQGTVGLYGQKEEVDLFLNVLQRFAQETKHPELVHLPWILVGHSTGGIYARNLAYWFPDRALGIIHIKSGNLHQHIPNPQFSLKGIPFVAINGELEEFGPEGGRKGGIREEYGRQTQWIMIRKQLLWLRAQDPEHLVSLVVDPKAGHTSWNEELTHFCILFIRKCFQYRLPSDIDPLKGMVRCRPLTLEQGWLTDGNIKKPSYSPRPYTQFEGDKAKAFWHLDQELAEATVRIHQRLLPDDPSLKEEAWWEPPPLLIPKYTWEK